jgi:integrase
MKYDIHGREVRLERAIEKLKKDNTVIAENKKSILDFDDYIMISGIKIGRRYKYLYFLQKFSAMLGKPFDQATKDDIKNLVVLIDKRKDLTEASKVDRKIIIKRFYKWLKTNDQEYPPETKWIKCSLKNNLCRLPEEPLTQEDVSKLADAATRPRDKAFVQCLYETGCRVGELLTIQIKNIAFDGYGAVLRVTGKTGDRRVRIVSSAPALATWLDFHPFKTDPEAYVWARKLHNGAKDKLPCGYNSTLLILRRLAKKAGLNKKVNPHLFRHSRATALANRLTEAQMKAHFGWVAGSDMAGVYVHLSGRDVDEAILDSCGMANKEKKIEEFRPLTCGRCKLQNSPASKFCTKCGYALSADIAIQAENESKRSALLMNELMKDPELRELVLRKMLNKGVFPDFLGSLDD